MRNKNIRTLAELQYEMQELKASYKQKGEMLEQDVKTYAKQFTISGLIKKYTSPNAFFKLDDKTHLSSKILSIVLPMLLNSTFFRKSGFITKALAALVSGKIGKSLDAETIVGIVNYVKSLFKSKEKDLAFEDFGIPPDSETY